jgi:acetoin:2,6-dichlorophenolindophenol oxidoreductase subunit alpha
MPAEESTMSQPDDIDNVFERYRRMLLVREFEELTIDIYRRGHTPGLVHASSGQEAVSVGVTSLMRDGDYLTSTHRGHGHCLARGMPIDAVMFEIMGRAEGCCKGKGGSMHLADPSLGIIGANGIVGGGVGIAAGAAFSARYLKTRGVSVVFIGEGTMSQGVVFETMNLAALWSLPLIYVCENNGMVEFTRAENLTAGTITGRAEAFGIPSATVDGMDIEEVVEATGKAIDRARAGAGPTFLEMLTYRYHGHHVAEVDSGYRTPQEIAAWRERDPIDRERARMIDRGLADPDTLDELRSAVVQLVQESYERGSKAELPDLAEVHTDVYAEVAR